jgi:uncharacterized protein YndB with AHSA1/START domain
MTSTQFTAEPGVPVVVITGELDAPRDLVFRAHVEPDLLAQWLGPRRLIMDVERYEARDGGRWRFVHRDAEGGAFGFHGVFHGDPSPDLTVRTFEYEGAPGHVSLETLTIEEHDGRSFLRTVAVYQSVEDRAPWCGAAWSRASGKGWSAWRSCSRGSRRSGRRDGALRAG